MIGVAEIKTMLPHRYPILLVDRVLDVVPGERLVARKAVTCNEPWYAQLPPDADEAAHAYPSMLLIESWCQSAGILAVWGQLNPDVLVGQVMLFGSMTDMRLGPSVRPGDLLEHRVRLLRALSDTMIFEGETIVDGVPVLEVGRVVMAMRPAAELRAFAPVPA